MFTAFPKFYNEFIKVETNYIEGLQYIKLIIQIKMSLNLLEISFTLFLGLNNNNN